jgi:hypothetical protein
MREFSRRRAASARADISEHERQVCFVPMNGKICRGPDPSQSYLGLAAWIAALDQMQPENHGGLSYTVDVDVTASAGARFEFVFSIVTPWILDLRPAPLVLGFFFVMIWKDENRRAYICLINLDWVISWLSASRERRDHNGPKSLNFPFSVRL